MVRISTGESLMESENHLNHEKRSRMIALNNDEL